MRYNQGKDKTGLQKDMLAFISKSIVAQESLQSTAEAHAHTKEWMDAINDIQAQILRIKEMAEPYEEEIDVIYDSDDDEEVASGALEE